MPTPIHSYRLLKWPPGVHERVKPCCHAHFLLVYCRQCQLPHALPACHLPPPGSSGQELDTFTLVHLPRSLETSRKGPVANLVVEAIRLLPPSRKFQTS